MSDSIGNVIARADIALSGLGHADSTLWQYRWAWSQFESRCHREGIDELTADVVASFVAMIASEHREGRLKEWKRKLLRKAVLVLAEVAQTGTYEWKLSRAAHPNDVLDAALRPVQEEFEAWLDEQQLAVATRELYATVSRTVLAWLPERGVSDISDLSAADVSAAMVFLGGSYRPGSMRTAVTAVRVLCRFLEHSGHCAGLSRAVPRQVSRRVGSVAALSAERVTELTNAPDPAAPTGRRDRAMLLLAARTGLRPVDIVGLRLDDIDWRQGQITVIQHKTTTSLTLPLLADVGDAIADYVLHDRPAGAAADHVFLRVQAPFAPLSSVYHVSARAFVRTAKPTDHETGRGFRVLRASLATRMLTEGTLLPVISGALGHRGIESVKHYLSADEERLRECCLDFTGIEPRTARS